MNRYILILLILPVAFFSCKGMKGGKKNEFASDRSVHIEFHPFWGGSASCDLARKNGKDLLVYMYDQVINGKDSISKAYVNIKQADADSIFSCAQKVNWTQPITNGTAEPKVGLKITITYKRRVPQTLSWERLVSAEELPGDVKLLLVKLNELAPDEFKIF